MRPTTPVSAVLLSIFLHLIGGCGPGPQHPSQPARLVQLQIRPEMPIEGDLVSVLIPFKSRPACFAPKMRPAARTMENGITHLWIEVDEPETLTAGMSVCPLTPGTVAKIEKLGRLPTGRYVVHAGNMEQAFVVLPPDTDPGPLVPEWRVRLAVARAYPHGDCFGMPTIDPHDDISAIPDDYPELWRQIRSAFAVMPERELLDLIANAWSVRVSPLGHGRFTYRFSDGHCCTIHEKAGEAKISRDGRVYVRPPVTLKTHHVDC